MQCSKFNLVVLLSLCFSGGLLDGEPQTRLNGDVNCSGVIDLSDAVYTLQWLFLGGGEPCTFSDPPELLEQLARLQADLAGCQEDLIASQASTIEAQQFLLSCQDSLGKTGAALEAKSAELVECDANLQEANAQRDALAAQLQATQTNLAAAESARDLCQDTLAQVNPELAACVADLAATQASLATCTGNLAATAQELAQVQADLAAAEARIADLESGAAMAAALARIAELEIPGCMDPAAANYNCHANVADGSCQYPGCTDPAAQNFDPQANVDDGSCRYPCTTDCPTISGFTLLGNNEQKYAEYVHNETGIVFVLLPGGTFMMGSPEDEPGRLTDEGPLHQVTLRSFLIGKHEVTQAEWQTVTGSNPSAFRGENRPVEQVSWDDCQTFCSQTGLKLPTEAQWEYACRAGRTGPYGGTEVLNQMGWYDANSGGHTHDVGSKEANGFGLYDMHGNVWEFCQDRYDLLFYTKPDATQVDPVNLSYGYDCIVRGGNYVASETACRSACRNHRGTSYPSPVYGLRLAYWPLP